MNDNSIKPFVYKVCNNVLPLVYDDALTYNDLVNKMISKVNEVISVTNELVITSEKIQEELVDTVRAFVAVYFLSDDYKTLLHEEVADGIEDELDYIAHWSTLTNDNNHIKFVAGVVRRTENGWAYIVNDNHEGKLNCTSTETSGEYPISIYNNRLKIDYPPQYKVISAYAACDETYTRNGYSCGVSCGLSNSLITLCHFEPKGFAGQVTINTLGNITVNPNSKGITSCTWDSSRNAFKIVHADLGSTGFVSCSLNVIQRAADNSTNTVRCAPIIETHSGEGSGTNTQIKFVCLEDKTIGSTTYNVGDVVTNPAVVGGFMISQVSSSVLDNVAVNPIDDIPPQSTIATNGNIWFGMMFKVNE